MSKKLLLIGSLCATLVAMTGCANVWDAAARSTDSAVEQTDDSSSSELGEKEQSQADTDQNHTTAYENTEYGFHFSLPNSWEGYTVISDTWQGMYLDQSENDNPEEGPIIAIRHPDWTSEIPRQDIPIMILTIAQWDALQAEKFHIGAAPIGPKELGRNNDYVFMLPARYNFAFPAGHEEVQEILNSNPLQPIEVD